MMELSSCYASILAQAGRVGKGREPFIPRLKTRGFLAHFCNVVFLALALAGARGFSMPAAILALVAFSFGAFAGRRLITKLSGHRGHLLAVASACEGIHVTGAVVLATRSAPSGASIATGPVQFGLIVLLGLAMGLQNAAARHLAVPDLTTAVLTLTITGITTDAHAAGGAGSWLGRRGLVVLVIFVGALVGGLLVIGGSGPISLVLALVILGGLTATAAVVSRATPSGAYAHDV